LRPRLALPLIDMIDAKAGQRRDSCRRRQHLHVGATHHSRCDYELAAGAAGGSGHDATSMPRHMMPALHFSACSRTASNS